MTLLVAVIGLILLGAWIDQALTQRARNRRQRDKPVSKWWTDPDDEGDY